MTRKLTIENYCRWRGLKQLVDTQKMTGTSPSFTLAREYFSILCIKNIVEAKDEFIAKWQEVQDMREDLRNPKMFKEKATKNNLKNKSINNDNS